MARARMPRAIRGPSLLLAGAAWLSGCAAVAGIDDVSLWDGGTDAGLHDSPTGNDGTLADTGSGLQDSAGADQTAGETGQSDGGADSFHVGDGANTDAAMSDSGSGDSATSDAVGTDAPATTEAGSDGGCSSGYHACGAVCSSNSSTQSCGTSCTACPSAPADGIPTCGGDGGCGFSCVNGFHECGGNSCADNTNVNSCGTSSCTPCNPPANATATCNGTMCGFTCTGSYVQNGGTCTPPASRPISPLTGNTVSSRTPTLTWLLPAGFTGAQVVVCSKPDCSASIDPLWTSPTVMGSSSAPSSVMVAQTLPTAITFWRVYTMDGTTRGSIASLTWEFQAAGTHSAPIASSWWTFADIEGDGWADVLGAPTAGPASILESQGTQSAGPANVVTGSCAQNANYIAGVGDINGDGLTDVIAARSSIISVCAGSTGGLSVAAQHDNPTGVGGCVIPGDVNHDGFADVACWTNIGSESAFVFEGSSTWFPTNPSYALTLPAGSTNALDLFPAGDVNADGFDDVLLGDPSYVGGGRTYLFLGGSAGLATTFSKTLGTPGGASRFGYNAARLGDVNGDGYGDWAVVDDHGGSTGNTNVVYIYDGAPTASLPASSSVAITSLMNGDTTNIRFVSGAGDVDGDGYSDMIAQSYAPLTVVLFGGPNGITESSGVVTSRTAVVAVGQQVMAEAPNIIGDTNGDGLADFAAPGVVAGTALFFGGTGPFSAPKSTLTMNGPIF